MLHAPIFDDRAHATAQEVRKRQVNRAYLSLMLSTIASALFSLKGDITTLEMKLYRNDTLQQHAHYELMIHKPDALLQEIQSFMSLEDGDIIMSGTPKGVATYKSGDLFRAEVYIEGEMIIDARFVAC
ncbi:MAG: fumarylacetoacetate hydrolase family protein [Sulfurovaceae bacterium]